MDSEYSEFMTTKEEKVKKHICDQYGYSYILLKKTKDAKKTAQQIIDVLRRRKVYIITNIDDDLKLIQQKYLELLRISIQGKQDDN